MFEVPTPCSLHISGDEWAWDHGTETFMTWKEKHLTPSTTSILEGFVTARIEGKGKATQTKSDTETGSFNQIYQYSFPDGTKAILRMPKPGHSAIALMEEKVRNEVAWMKCFKEKTSMRIAHIYASSADEDLPRSKWPFGLPFILMEYLEGENLRNFLVDLPKVGESEESDKLRVTVYEDVARFLLELRSIRLHGIGSVTRDEKNEWVVTERPLIMNMEEAIAYVPNIEVGRWPKGPFTRCSDYVKFRLSEHEYLLRELRNINMPRELFREEMAARQIATGAENIDFEQAGDIARARFQSHQAFSAIANELYRPDEAAESGPFLPSNSDLDPRNMLVDPDTGKVVGMVDLEFNNAMPARYSYDPPYWLAKVLPKKVLEVGLVEWWETEYEPALELFLQTMKSVEESMGNKLDDFQTPLSELTRDSFDSGTFWVNMGLDNVALMDSIYWLMLDRLRPKVFRAPCLDDEMEREMEEYVDFSRRQIIDYERTREEKREELEDAEKAELEESGKLSS